MTRGSEVHSLSPLRQLARLYGIQTAYYDVFHRRKDASPESLLATLQALGAPMVHPRDIAGAVRERKQEIWKQAMEPVLIAWDGALRDVKLRASPELAQGRVKCRIVLEDGEELLSEFARTELPPVRAARLEGTRYFLKRLPLSATLPLGYHRLQIQFPTSEIEALIIAAPRRAFEPTTLTWGVFLPIYALHSERSWGAGDLSDLEALLEWVTRLGGGIVSTLPFLAFLDEPFDPSPYAPASRLFWNELYADPRRTEEFKECRVAQELVQSTGFQQELDDLRAAPYVDYRRQMRLKRRVFEQLARWMIKERPDRFAADLNEAGARSSFEDYASFRATLERRRIPWSAWPEPLKSGLLREGDYDEEVKRYHLYVQRVTETQVARLAQRAKESNRGLYLDFPLGVHRDSYDVWRHRELFALDASGGAPPDAVFTGGQDWVFPPLHPERIRTSGYDYFIDCLRHHLRYAGLVRIDHVMGLHRLYWIPKGCDARDGVYVRYRAEECYAIVCLESQRFGIPVVGENLGTVPAVVNHTMARHGVQKMYVVQYEARPRRLKPLKPIPSDAVASLNTHDMPPFAAYLDGLDVQERVDLGLLTHDAACEEQEHRRTIRQALPGFLSRAGRLSKRSDDAETLLRGCLAWLGASPARLALVNLEDLWLETAPQNIPGTGSARPNWQKKARYSLEEFARMPQVVGMLQMLSELRGGTAP